MDIDRETTPTRRGIPSTVVVKTRRRARGPRKSRKETTWTQYYFDVTILEETWNHPGLKNKPLVANRLWICKICGPSFKSTDQERHGNTSRLVKHLKEQHDMDEQKHKLGVQPKQRKGLRGFQPITGYMRSTEPIPSAEEAILQFVTVTNQAFQTIEHKTFENLYKSVGTTPSISSADTLKTRLLDRFNLCRKQMAKEIKDTCETFSISFDGWSSQNHTPILGCIMHWITPDFKRRSMVIEFAELIAGKSGKAMADILYDSIGPDFKKETEIIEGDMIKTITEERIGLKCAEKLFAVCGDNTPANDTFADHLLNLLQHDYDDDPSSTSGLPKCRFHGRSSRIRCIAHIIALVVGAVLKELKSGTHADAVDLVATTYDQGGVFDPNICLALSVYQRV
jgi:hypothetical protein